MTSPASLTSQIGVFAGAKLLPAHRTLQIKVQPDLHHSSEEKHVQCNLAFEDTQLASSLDINKTLDQLGKL